jgi:hypothetical protein
MMWWDSVADAVCNSRVKLASAKLIDRLRDEC